MYLIVWCNQENEDNNTHLLKSQDDQETAATYLIEKAKFDNMDFSMFFQRKMSENEQTQEPSKWQKISSFINQFNVSCKM